MSWTVTVYYDNVVDETHYFEDEGKADKLLAKLRKSYRRNRLYRVEKRGIGGNR